MIITTVNLDSPPHANNQAAFLCHNANPRLRVETPIPPVFQYRYGLIYCPRHLASEHPLAYGYQNPEFEAQPLANSTGPAPTTLHCDFLSALKCSQSKNDRGTRYEFKMGIFRELEI
jgi:hypothetical protein